MSSKLLILICVALTLASAGVLLWGWSVSRKERQMANETLAKRMALGGSFKGDDLRFGNPTAQSQPLPVRKTDRLTLPEWLLGAFSAPQLLGLLGLVALLTLVVGVAVNWISGAGIFSLSLLAVAFVTWLKLKKLRARLIQQLPSFLDVMIRLIRAGTSTQSAFQQAVSASEAPLRLHMDKAMSLVRADRNIDQALEHVANRVGVQELHLLASILGLGVRYGGRSDVILERVANFMRDREEMEQELMAMSAETRISAWILSLLPLFVAGAIVVINGAYFGHMWNDPTGQNMIFIAVALQIAGVLMLYRLAHLD
jgi:tight adherence protein B